MRLGQKNLEKISPSKTSATRANALLCPSCCVEYVQVEFDMEVDGVVLHNVKALKCPGCEEEVFTPQQVEAIKNEAIKKRINNSSAQN